MPPGVTLAVMETTAPFRDRFTVLFEAQHPRLYRYLDRVSGEPALAADLAQEAFVRLLRRGSMPEEPNAWLVTVAMNLFRNHKSTSARRRRLLTIPLAEGALSDPPPAPDQDSVEPGTRARVRAAIDRLDERERDLLLLRAEGYSYREIADALGLNESSVGTLLARAKHAFRTVYEG